MSSPAERKEIGKSDARSSRLSFKNHKREQLHQDFLAEQRATCRPAFAAFAECAEDNGMLVVFKCRDHQKAVNECLRPLTGDDKFNDWLRAHGKPELVKQV